MREITAGDRYKKRERLRVERCIMREGDICMCERYFMRETGREWKKKNYE